MSNYALYSVYGRTPSGTSEYFVATVWAYTAMGAISKVKKTMPELVVGLKLYAKLG